MVVRCPNCGAPVRPGAKFCTTCGLRLPESDAGAANESEPTPSPARTEVEPPAAPAWAAAETFNGWPSQPAATAEQEPATTAETVPEDPFSVLDEAADVGAVPIGPTESVAPPKSPAEVERFHGWPSWVAEPSVAEPPAAPASDLPAWATEARSEPVAEPPLPSRLDERPAPAAEVPTAAIDAAPPVTSELTATVASATQPATEPGAIAMDTPPTPLDLAPEADGAAATAETGGMTETPETAAATPPPPAAAPLVTATRAQALLDELRSAVQELAARAGAAGPGDDREALAAELEAVRREGLDGDDAAEALRATLATAQDRPRDVDAMLDLMSRLDAIVAVQQAHDRYLAAIDRAIARLRGQEPPAN